MASTPVILLVKRTGNASDRPNTATVQAGEVALSFGGADPGLYFKDSAAAIRKIGPPHYGSTAPNSSPVGSAGNSVGELWVTSSSPYYMQVWNGSSWQKVGAAFADSSNIASVTIASGALVANSTPIASGSLGSVLSSGSLGSILSSGSLGSVLSSGSLGSVLSSGSLGCLLASGALVADSTLIASGALGSVLSSGSLGAILSSGVITATGVPCADIYTGVLVGTSASGSLRYKIDNTGSPSGLYVAFAGGWALV